jgi:hypothetical protein
MSRRLFPATFALRHGSLSWREASAAWQAGWLLPADLRAVADHNVSTQDSAHSLEYELAFQSAAEPAAGLAAELAALDPPLDEQAFQAKWFRLAVLWATEALTATDIAQRLDQAYCALDHPAAFDAVSEYLPGHAGRAPTVGADEARFRRIVASLIEHSETEGRRQTPAI